jgi:hypothetical protein
MASLKFPPMPSEYYRRQAARVRSLAHGATTLAIREHLADVVLQYEKLAEGADAGYHDPQFTSAANFWPHVSGHAAYRQRKWQYAPAASALGTATNLQEGGARKLRKSPTPGRTANAAQGRR